MAAKPIPEGFHTLSPQIVVNDANAAIEFYQKAFGAEEMMRMPGPGGSVMHAELMIGNSPLMLADPFPGGPITAPQSLNGTSCCLHLYVEDVDAAFKRAVDAGAKVIMPITDMFWGDRYCLLQDPFDHKWSIATHKVDLSPEECAKRGAEFMAQGDCSGDRVRERWGTDTITGSGRGSITVGYRERRNRRPDPVTVPVPHPPSPCGG